MVEVLNLSRSFGAIKAVDDLSFTVARGEVLGFLGPNGAGKSTTMKMLTGFLAPTSGTAKVCGHDIITDSFAVRESVGYLPESAPAYAEMTVEAFLIFIARIRGLSGAGLSKAVDAVIDMCFLGGVRRQQFETLSKGFKRRTVLAQALIHDPEVLIMDEPTDGLDPNQKHEVRELISRMASNKVIILSTHILEEVSAVCTRAIIIAEGRLLSDRTPEQLKQQSKYHGAVVLGVRTNEPESIKAALSAIGGAKSVETIAGDSDIESDIHEFRIFPKKGKTIAASVGQIGHEKGWDIEHLQVEQGRLDEVFRDLTLKGSKQRS